MEEAQIQSEKKTTIPRDATTLYMENRQGIINSVDEYEHYKRLMESINIGSSLLPNGSSLKAEAEKILTNKTSYLPKRKMELTSDKIYSISTSGEESSGFIKVRPEELERGERCILNQQASSLIWRLKLMDNKIFKELIDKNIISMYGIGQLIEKEIKKGLEDGI